MRKRDKITVTLSIVGICVLIAIGLLLNGCGLPWSINGKGDGSGPTGNLLLSVSEPISPLVFLPDGDNVVAHYIVTITPQTTGGDPRFQDVPAPPPPEGVLFGELEEDFYDIDIQGLNSSEELITQGFDVVSVVAQELTETIIQMEVLPGVGDAQVQIHIDPYDYVPYDLVTGSWYTKETDSWSAAPWSQVSQGEWDLQMPGMGVGYHIAAWELFSSGYETFKVCGAAEAVYIRKDRLSFGEYFLDPDILGEAISSGAALTIIWEAPSPIFTMFTDGISEVIVGNEYTLTTVTDADPIDSHAWYADGVLMPDETSVDLTATAPSEPGRINYSKIGFKGDIITSAQKLIVFVEQPYEGNEPIDVAYDGDLTFRGGDPLGYTIESASGQMGPSGYWHVHLSSTDQETVFLPEDYSTYSAYTIPGNEAYVDEWTSTIDGIFLNGYSGAFRITSVSEPTVSTTFTYTP